MQGVAIDSKDLVHIAGPDYFECPVHGKIALHRSGMIWLQEVLQFSSLSFKCESPEMCLYCLVDFFAKNVPRLKKL